MFGLKIFFYEVKTVFLDFQAEEAKKKKCYTAAACYCAKNRQSWDFWKLPWDHWVLSFVFIPWTSAWLSVVAGWHWACAGAGGPRWCLNCHRHSYQLQWRSVSAIWWHRRLRKANIRSQDIHNTVGVFDKKDCIMMNGKSIQQTNLDNNILV